MALDEALVATTNRFKIRKGNQRLSHDLKSNEATIQVVLDALKLTQGMYTMKHVDYVSLLWEDLIYQVENKNAKKNNDIVISRYQDTQIYRAILPNVLTSQDMLEFKAYKEYYAFASGAVPPKAKTSYKKKAKEPVSSKTASEYASKGDGVGKLLKVPDEQEQEDTSTDEGADTLSGIFDVPKKKCSTQSDEDKFYYEESNDDDESLDNEDNEDIKELYDDVNINLGNIDAEMIDANQGTAKQHVYQEEEYAHRVSALEIELSELKQTNQFVEAISYIPGIVDKYMAFKMKEAMDVAVQLQTNKLREEAQAENEEFLNQ
nr:hypothetical protein [Tanacetum cinerariifolium]